MATQQKPRIHHFSKSNNIFLNYGKSDKCYGYGIWV